MTRLAGMRRMAGSRRSCGAACSRVEAFTRRAQHPARSYSGQAAHGDSEARSCSTNDAVLVAVAAALHQILLNMNESIDPIVVTVPVSGRRSRGGREVGNLVSPMLVNVPTGGGVAERLADVEAAVRARKVAATSGGRSPTASKAVYSGCTMKGSE